MNFEQTSNLYLIIPGGGKKKIQSECFLEYKLKTIMESTSFKNHDFCNDDATVIPEFAL